MSWTNTTPATVSWSRRDPFSDGSVVALLSMNGSNNGTTFTEETGKTVTRVGTPVTKTGTKKFGTAAFYSGAVGSQLSLTDSEDWVFGDDPFTIDFWVNTSKPGSSAPALPFGQCADRNNMVMGLCRWDSGDVVMFYVRSNGEDLLSVSGPIALTESTWHHIAIIRGWKGCPNDFVVCIDSVPGTVVTADITMPDISATFTIGGNATYGNFGAGECPIDYIDEFRVVKGYAYWIDTFTPPVAEYGYDPVNRYWTDVSSTSTTWA